MKNIIKVCLIGILFLGIGFSCLAQEMPEVLLDEDINTSDLGIEKPRILPDHPLYFLKNGWRKVREFFTFDKISKLNLKEKYASERIIELKELVKKGVPAEVIKKAADYYKQESEEIKNQVMELKQKAQENPQINSFLEKFIHQETLHYRILEKLENQVPSEVFEKIKEQRELHLERFKDVMLKLEEKEKIPEKLENVLEKFPEKTKEKIKEVEEKILKKLKISEELNLDEDDNNRQITLEKNQVLTIGLESNPSTGYTWEIEEMNESILQKIEEKFEQESELLGAPGKQTFDFKAIKEGQTGLKLVYHRPWEKEAAPNKIFSIQVTVVNPIFWSH